MKEKTHRCRTYFSISGSFDVQQVMSYLGITVYRYYNKGDTCAENGHTYTHSEIIIGYNDDFDIDTTNMMEITIEELTKITSKLIELKSMYNDIDYVLEVVPEMYYDSKMAYPIIGVSKKVMQFLVDVDAEIDFDYYIY